MLDITFLAADLAPGDQSALRLDTAKLEIARVVNREDPYFESAYSLLWAAFGPQGELESREVLGRRLARPVGFGADGLAMRYDLLVVVTGGEIVAIRDHTAIASKEEVVVHLSHVWVAESQRRTGLAGCLRALPLQTARATLAQGGLPETLPITLVAEMEYADGVDPQQEVRLLAYERAGFLKIDPALLQYFQPDFRMDSRSATSHPLPFQLVVRRVGREDQKTICHSEATTIVDRLLSLYARELAALDVASARALLVKPAAAVSQIALLPPTS